MPVFGPRTQELGARRSDGKIRLVGPDYSGRFVEAGFVRLARYVPSDFPVESMEYQFKEYRPAGPRAEEPLEIFAKPGGNAPEAV